MLILSSIEVFLNTCREKIYEGSKDKVRKEFDIPENQALYYNGYWYKSTIYIDKNNSLKKVKIPIRRLLWIMQYGERKHIYVYPSFVIKYCPFPLNDLEKVYVEFLSRDIEPFKTLKDPECLLDSSIPYENWTNNLGHLLKEKDFQANWARLFCETFHTSPSVDKDSDFLSQCLGLISDFIKKLFKGSTLKYNLLSYANFQMPFR